MIKKLRNKFIAVNMLLVSLVLLFVFLSIYISDYKNYYNRSIDSMQFALQMGNEFYIPQHEIGGINGGQKGFTSDVFTVNVDEDGNITQKIISNNLDVPDNILKDVVKTALKDSDDIGVIRNYSVRYLKQTNSDGSASIAFDYIEVELDSMRNMLINSLLIGAGSLLALFLISWFLANIAIKPVEKSFNQQRQFVADASHELKTPLTVILANTDILLNHKKDTISKQSKWVENTKTEAERMTTLVNDLLFLAKVDAEKINDKGFLKFNISDTVIDSALSFESVAFEKGITLNNQVEPDLFINGDESKIKQLIMILLDNACKYSVDKGTIKISLTANSGNANLSVINMGDVITPENQKRIFERFYRVDESRAREEGGYGLGLPIAKSITDIHNGKITVTSSKENGTCFTVSIPISK